MRNKDTAPYYVKINRIWVLGMVIISLTIGTYGFHTWYQIEHDKNQTQIELKKLEVK